MRFAVFPIGQVPIRDNWHAPGLRGTGGSDYAVSDMFVPEHFTFALGAFPARRGRSTYLMVWPRFLVDEHLVFALSIARCWLGTVTSLAQSKRRGYGQQTALADRAVFQMATGDRDLRLRALRAVVSGVVEKVWVSANSGQVPNPQSHAEMRNVVGVLTDVAAYIPNTAFHFREGTAIQLDHVVQCCLRGLRPASAHFVVNDSS